MNFDTKQSDKVLIYSVKTDTMWFLMKLSLQRCIFFLSKNHIKQRNEKDFFSLVKHEAEEEMIHEYKAGR